MKEKRCPDTAALLKITEFRNAETIHYAADRYDQTMAALKLQHDESARNMSASLHEYANVLESEQPSMQAAMRASFDAIKAPAQIRQYNLAMNAQKSLNDMKSRSIKMIYGVSETSDILRVYSIDGEATDPSTDEKIDAVFHGWLIDHNLLIQEGVLYESNEEGEPQLNTDGTLKRAKPDRISQLLENPEQGLSSYFKRRGVLLETQVYPYPESKKEEIAKSSQTKVFVDESVSQTPEIGRQESGMIR